MNKRIIDEGFQEEGSDVAPPGAQLLRQGRAVRLSAMDPGSGVLCLKGLLWVTRENDHEDHILNGSSAWTRPGPGLVVIEALRDSVFRVLKPGAACLKFKTGKEKV